MSGKIITISTNKGGAGKTTIVTNLACDFAIRNPKKNVCLIDLDGQCGVSIILGKGPTKYIGNSILSFIKRDKKELEEVAFKDVKDNSTGELIENLYFIPAEPELQSFDDLLNKQINLSKNLETTLKFLKEQFDYVFIDTQPTLSILNRLLYSISDFIVCPFEPEMQNIQGFRNIINEIKHGNYTNNPFIYMLPIKVKEKTLIDRGLLDLVYESIYLEKNKKLFVSEIKIPYSTQYKAIVAKEKIPLICSKAKSKAIETQKELIRSISDEIIELLK
ncbi:MAG: ParA family protein [Ureaplasma sp.]|nr:ParA family protein [Ureaplasma sp.]